MKIGLIGLLITNHPDVIGYPTYSKADLFDFDPKHPSQSFAIPRSWNYVSEILNTEGFDTVQTSSKRQKLSGAIGEGMAIKFVNTERLVPHHQSQKMFRMVKLRNFH